MRILTRQSIPSSLKNPTLSIRFEVVELTKREPKSSTVKYMAYVTSSEKYQ